MLFLVIEKVSKEIPVEALESSSGAVEYFNELTKKGKLLNHYHFAGIPGGALVIDAASNDELGEILIKSPFYRFTTREIYPVMSPEKMVTAEQSVVSASLNSD